MSLSEERGEYLVPSLLLQGWYGN